MGPNSSAVGALCTSPTPTPTPPHFFLTAQLCPANVWGSMKSRGLTPTGHRARGPHSLQLPEARLPRTPALQRGLPEIREDFGGDQ